MNLIFKFVNGYASISTLGHTLISLSLLINFKPISISKTYLQIITFSWSIYSFVVFVTLAFHHFQSHLVSISDFLRFHIGNRFFFNIYGLVL